MAAPRSTWLDSILALNPIEESDMKVVGGRLRLITAITLSSAMVPKERFTDMVKRVKVSRSNLQGVSEHNYESRLTLGKFVAFDMIFKILPGFDETLACKLKDNLKPPKTTPNPDCKIIRDAGEEHREYLSGLPGANTKAGVPGGPCVLSVAHFKELVVKLTSEEDYVKFFVDPELIERMVNQISEMVDPGAEIFYKLTNNKTSTTINVSRGITSSTPTTAPATDFGADSEAGTSSASMNAVSMETNRGIEQIGDDDLDLVPLDHEQSGASHALVTHEKAKQPKITFASSFKAVPDMELLRDGAPQPAAGSHKNDKVITFNRRDSTGSGPKTKAYGDLSPDSFAQAVTVTAMNAAAAVATAAATAAATKVADESAAAFTAAVCGQTETINKGMETIKEGMGRMHTEIGTEIDGVRTEVTKVGAQVTKMDAEVTKVGAQVTKMDAEVSKVGAEVTKMGAEVSKVGAEVSKVGAEVTKMRTEVGEKLEEIEENQDFLREMQEHAYKQSCALHEQIVAEADATNAKVDEVRNEMRKENNLRREKENEKRKLKMELKELEKQKNKLERKLQDELRDDLGELMEQMKELKKQIGEKEEKKNFLELMLKGFTKTIDEASENLGIKKPTIRKN